MYKFTADNIGDIARGLSMPQLIHFLGTYDILKTVDNLFI